MTEAGRAAFYAAEGRWSARIEDLGPRRAEALRAIRTLRDDPPAALSRVLSGAAPVVEGTLAEVECVELALEEAGAELVMSRLA